MRELREAIAAGEFAAYVARFARERNSAQV
jgi:queuine/archaeosine tRNA-ribosyltransferase